MIKKYVNLLPGLILTLVVVVAVGSYLLFKSPNNESNIANVISGTTYSLNIENKDVSLIISDTPESLKQGLSNRDSLPKDNAMLFVFDRPYKYGFWMKDMFFSIDIVWIDELGKVIHIEKNLSPSTYPNVFFPPLSSLYVLETNGNFTDENNISVGNILLNIKR